MLTFGLFPATLGVGSLQVQLHEMLPVLIKTLLVS